MPELARAQELAQVRGLEPVLELEPEPATVQGTWVKSHRIRREESRERLPRDARSQPPQKNLREMLKPRYQLSLDAPPRATWPIVVP